MNCTNTIDNNQSNFEASCNFLKIPSNLERFINTKTTIEKNFSGCNTYVFYGEVLLSDNELICEHCGSKMHIHQAYSIIIKHLPFGSTYSSIKLERKQLKCSHCGCVKMQEIPFKDDNHMITKQLKTYTEDLLKTSNFTNKEVAYLTGLNRNTVKEIDKKRLMDKYTVDGEGKEFIKPTHYSRRLGIDEFKLHDGYKYATHIINYDTGEILWIRKGKKKQVVYDFIEFVGKEWMEHVEVVGCDMNSDFEEAFKEMCPHIKIVYDYFHIVKNFNDKVVSEVRKDEQRRLEKEGDKKGAAQLKRSRFILTSSEKTLKKKDQEVATEKEISKGSELFGIESVTRKGDYYNRYMELVNSNDLFLRIELIKELLGEAYKADEEEEMAKLIFDIMELCEESGNEHFIWFKKLLYNHFDGIISHATYKISSGKIEGINNKIKTLRRQHYGLPDDEYFFLKLFDMSRN